ncbi:MAG: hypothetical protein P8182_01490 [Deltaproteobacteria bacterium]
MDHRRCSPQMYRTFLLAVVFCALVAYGLYWARENLIPFFMTRPWMNGAITAVGVLGLVLSFRELVRLIIEARRLDNLARGLGGTASRQSVDGLLSRRHRGLVGDRCRRVLEVMKRGSAGATQAATVLSDADEAAEEGREALVLYLIGVMVFLGLIGTFWGLVITVSGVKHVLATLEPAGVDDAAAFITELKSSIGGLLGGMSTAFSTSLFGLGGSVIVGFVDVQTRQARARFLADLDRVVVSSLFPAISGQVEPVATVTRVTEGLEPEGERLYHLAFQEALGENLRRLTDVILLQSSAEEKVTNSLVEMKGMLESLREEEVRTREAIQSANETRRGLLDRLDNLDRHTERLLNETRLTRESSDDIGKEIQDRLKLEGEITNKTLSMGFSDLTRKLDALRKGKAEPPNPEKEGE